MKALALSLSLLLSSCSVLFMERPPKTIKPGQQVHCTASSGWMLWDSVQVLAHTVTGIIVLQHASELADDPNSNRSTNQQITNIGVGNVVFAVGHTLSAVAGARWSSRCTEARKRAARSK
jgi:hypothetical protein